MNPEKITRVYRRVQKTLIVVIALSAFAILIRLATQVIPETPPPHLQQYLVLPRYQGGC